MKLKNNIKRILNHRLFYEGYKGSRSIFYSKMSKKKFDHCNITCFNGKSC